LGTGLLLCGLVAVAQADDAEQRRSFPARSGTTAPGTGIQKRLLDTARTQPATGDKAQADQDLQHVAVLEEDGSLLEFIESGVFLTRTVAIVQRFYASHADDYDGLVIFSAGDFAGDIEPESGFAFELNIANDIEGIGLPTFNEGGTLVPGLQRLRTVINMNDLGEYDQDPDARLSFFLDSSSGVGILAQEFLHSVGAFVNADNVDILGRGGVHWSFFFQSHGSPLEGNNWIDNGDGTFTSSQPTSGFSQLDLYLLGILEANEVTDPMWAITSPVPDLLDLSGDATLPVAGVTLAGTRTTVTMQNITSLHGERVPSAASAPKDFRVAFVLVAPPNVAVSDFDLEKIDDFRTQWQEWFARETDGLARMHTELGIVPVTADFEADVFAGPPGTTLRFDNDSYGSIRGFSWEFGDGGTSSERHASHTYDTPGIYTVRLDVNGETDSQQRTRDALVRIGPLHTWFEDTFETDQGWSADPLDNATSGRFLRAPPIGSWLRAEVGNDTVAVLVQPEFDHTPDGFLCYVTGVTGADREIGVADVDDGITSLVSPPIDLSQAEDPVLEWWAWYVNNAGASPGRDVFTVDVSDDDGQTWVRARTFRSTFDHWRQLQVRLLDHISLSATVRVRFQFSDNSFPSIVEGAIDDVHVFDVDTTTPVRVSGFQATAQEGTVQLTWEVQRGADPIVALEVQSSKHAAGPWTTLRRLAATTTSFADHPDASGQQLWYRLVVLSQQGAVVGPALAVDLQPVRRDALDAVAVNSDGSVLVRYRLARPGTVHLSFYDVRGRRLAQRSLGLQPAGNHVVSWDRRSDSGRAVGRGLTLVRLDIGGQVWSRKLLLLR
jgi:hypothetical protein